MVLETNTRTHTAHTDSGKLIDTQADRDGNSDTSPDTDGKPSQAIVEAKAIEIWKMNREARNEKWRKTDTTTTANATARRGHNI